MPTPVNLYDDRILVRHEKASELSQGGIVLPSTTKPPFFKSVVLAVGPGPVTPTLQVRRPLDVKVGDVVAHYAPGTKFDLDGEELHLIREGDVLGTFPQQARKVKLC